jgi:MoxR-like ATPase/Mg-chelatase subunit ChlD
MNDRALPPLVGRDREFELFVACLNAGRNLLIEGPVGVGKTRLAQEGARVLKRSVIRVDGDERYSEEKLAGWFDPPAVISLGYVQDAFQPGPLYQAMSRGALLFINEVNRMPDGVQNILLPALDENILEIPRLEAIRAAEGFQVVATQNPKEFVGTSLISEALRDRFELLTLDYQSFEEEEAIVAQLTGLTDTVLIREAVFLTRSTRSHPLVRRGASVRAAASLVLIASNLSGNDALSRAAEMALPTRVEFQDVLEEDQPRRLGQFLEDVVKKKSPEARAKLRLKSLDPGPDDEKLPRESPGQETDGMFPSGATFLCPDWKIGRLRPGMGPAVDAFRRLALPRLLTRPGVFAGTASIRTRKRTVPHGAHGAGPVDLALEATLDRILPTLGGGRAVLGARLRKEDIQVRYRPEPILRLLVMLDTSLSMSGPHRAPAAVIGAVLSKQSPSGGLALIAFHSEPELLIRFGERVKPLDAAYRVLGAHAGGITNISAALGRGLSMLVGSRNRSAHAVLITDGERTAGSDPCDEAKRFRRLHVVLVGGRNVDSSREMARLGKGLWSQVDSLAEVPSVLLRLLQRLGKD